jgi:hypothetical protein
MKQLSLAQIEQYAFKRSAIEIDNETLQYLSDSYQFLTIRDLVRWLNFGLIMTN